ncbi:MAG: hypothetical protein F6K24_02250 [Okeania sp. SIO2D1]|nr:hypothetical protein [Okeania sp. SIO2D1]
MLEKNLTGNLAVILLAVSLLFYLEKGDRSPILAKRDRLFSLRLAHKTIAFLPPTTRNI